MQLETSGELRRINLARLTSLVPVMVQQWTALRFDESGRVVNPISGASSPLLMLVEGRHRQPGTRYLLRVPSTSANRHDHDGDRRQRRSPRASGPGQVDQTLVMHLRHDDGRRLAASIGDEDGRWTVDFEFRHGTPPRLELTGRADVGALMREEGVPRCLTSFPGRHARGRATIDLGVLDTAGGTLLDAAGRTKRFGASTHCAITGSATRWSVEARLTVSGKGLGRLVMLLVGRRTQRHVEQQLRQFWRQSGWDNDLERDLRTFGNRIDAAGGEAPYVHRALWDPAFDPWPHSRKP